MMDSDPSLEDVTQEETGVRLRVYPTRIQQQVLKRWIGTQRYLYNCKVEELEYQLWLKKNAKFSNRYQAPEADYCPWDQSFSQYRNSARWLERIPSYVRRNSCSRFKAGMSKWGSGTGAKPQRKTRRSKQSVLLTSECFSLQTVLSEGVKEVKLFLGPKNNNFGILKWVAHTDFGEPRQISISHEPDGKWFVGFTAQAREWVPAPQVPRTINEVLGADRGVVNPVTDNTGRFYDFTPAEKTKLLRREKKRTDLQIKLARQKKGSRRRSKTKKQIATTYARDRRLRTAVAHRISNHLMVQAVERGCVAIGFEDLRLGNMTRVARPKPDPLQPQHYLPNGGAAKSGLNRALLGRNLGRIKAFADYKCRRLGLQFVQVDPAGTSLQCTACQHQDPRNRLSQADFCCVHCGHQEHADVVGGTNVQFKAFQKITEISPETSLKNARPAKARKGPTGGGAV